MITLLILDVRLPAGPLDLPSLRAMAPSLLAFALSFAIAAVYRMSHHLMPQQMNVVDSRLLWSSLLLPLFVVFLPLPTAMLSAHPENALALGCYGANLIAVNGAGLLLWRHGTAIRREGRLARALIGLVLRVHAAPAFVYAVAIALAFVRPVASLVLCALVPAFFILPQSWLDRWIAAAGREH